MFLLAASTAWGVTKMLIPVMQRRGVLDVPNERSSHDAPRPRGGGLGILAGIAVGTATAGVLGLDLPGVAFFISTALVALVGFADDRTGGISPWLRLFLQILAAGLVVFSSGGMAYVPLPPPFDVPLGTLGMPLAIIWIVGITNIYNFLDGIDGYAGVQGMVAGLGLALLSGLYPPFIMGVVLAGACAGFLPHNWQPARIFMGDVGAYPLGFMLAALPFELASTGQASALFAVGICLWFFLADGTFTIIRRLFKREQIWRAHRSHLYQRLVKSGLEHSQVVQRIGGGAVVLVGTMVASITLDSVVGQWGTLLGAVVLFVVYYAMTRRREAQRVDVSGQRVML